MHSPMSSAPSKGKYLPAGQRLHTESEDAAKAVENFPLGHIEHMADPLTFLNLPWLQALQLPPSGPVYP